MKSAYIETTAINKAWEAGITGRQIADALTSLKLRPKTSILTLQELAKTYLDEHNKQAARELCTIVKDIKPTFIPEINYLIVWEAQKVWEGCELPVFEDSYQEVIGEEVRKLACGILSDEARDLILGRDMQIRQEIPDACEEIIDSVREAKKQKPGIFKELRSFDDFLNHYKDNYADSITKHLMKNVLHVEAELLAHNIDDFPVLRSLVRSDLYMTFILVAHEEVPARDKTHDLKHIISASYCDTFLSADSEQIKLVKSINPDLKILPWDDFIEKAKISL